MIAPTKAAPPASGHLDYYVRHGISPVRYRTGGLGAHFERREALYRLLGLPPVAFKGARVLEVAAGSGQNSLYVAACLPARFDLVEPNPAGLHDIEAAYAGLEVGHTKPVLHPVMIQDFETDAPFDIVLCENWLGSLAHERAIIARLAGLVAPGGVLVMTAVPLAGFFPNIVRKLLALRLIAADEDFDKATARLLKAFSPHLETIDGMTRSHRDWIHDCMLNPHYLHVALPIATLLEAAGDNMDVLGTSPRFATDWRWFKGMAGAGRAFNDHLLASELAELHNFMDCRKVLAPRRPDDNLPLAEVLDDGYAAALAWQDAWDRNDDTALKASAASVSDCLGRLACLFDTIDAQTALSLVEVGALWDRDAFEPEDVASLARFGGLFGRETVYVSMGKRRAYG